MHLEQGNASWSFEGIADNFIKHARQSIPGYDDGHNIVVRYSDFFCARPTTIIEIGCSTGQLLNKLASHHHQKTDLNLLGIEKVEDMHAYAEKNTKDDRISILHDAVENVSLPTSNFIVSYYTMQFISPAIRQQIIQKIYDSLEWGGAFMLFEKVRGPDARFQDYASQIYMEFKLKNGFKENEILNKSMSLKGMMEPFSTQGNIDLLNRAGFSDITSVFKWVSFEGMLAVK